jgi:flagellar hook protein FlgE
MGTSHTLTLEFIPFVENADIADGEFSNTWTLNIYDSATDPDTAVNTYTITFNDGVPGTETAGTIASVVDGAGDPVGDNVTGYNATGNLPVSVGGGTSSIDLNIGVPNGLRGITQIGGEFKPLTPTKDGSPFGELSSHQINEKGIVEAIFTNGERRALYQVPVASVVSPNALNPLGGQTYAITPEAGGLYFWDSGEGSVGTTTGYALTKSTTDVAVELTGLIETQRAYSSNAKIIQTVDEMLQETTNLKR